MSKERAVTDHMARIEAKPRGECLGCGYPTDADVCPECGRHTDGRDQIRVRYQVVTRVRSLFVAAIAIEGTFALVDALAPSIRYVPLIPGAFMNYVWILFQILTHAIPPILVAIAAAQVALGPWYLVPRERRRLKAASLLILTFPAYWLGFQTLALSGPGIASDLAQLVHPFVTLTTLTGVVLLFRGIGLCSDRDRGGAERKYLRYVWLGVAIPAGFTVLGSFAILYVSWRVGRGMPAPANAGLLQATLLETIGYDLGRNLLFLLVIITPGLWPWRKALAEVQADPPSPGR